MKRTISEIIDLIKQKKESAINTRKKHIDNKSEYASYIDTGYIEAYTDILALLETSHLIEKEKAIEILKNKFAITLVFYPDERVDNLIRFISKTDYEKTGFERRTVEKITDEEFVILREAFEND